MGLKTNLFNELTLSLDANPILIARSFLRSSTLLTLVLSSVVFMKKPGETRSRWRRAESKLVTTGQNSADKDKLDPRNNKDYTLCSRRNE